MQTTPPPALVERLVHDFGARWVDEGTVDDWAAEGGDRVLLLAGDPVQFPEGLDVAVVLPELRRSVGPGIVPLMLRPGRPRGGTGAASWAISSVV